MDPWLLSYDVIKRWNFFINLFTWENLTMIIPHINVIIPIIIRLIKAAFQLLLHFWESTPKIPVNCGMGKLCAATIILTVTILFHRAGNHVFDGIDSSSFYFIIYTNFFAGNVIKENFTSIHAKRGDYGRTPNQVSTPLRLYGGWWW